MRQHAVERMADPVSHSFRQHPLQKEGAGAASIRKQRMETTTTAPHLKCLHIRNRIRPTLILCREITQRQQAILNRQAIAQDVLRGGEAGDKRHESE